LGEVRSIEHTYSHPSVCLADRVGKCMKVMVVSNDSDLLQLVDEQTSVTRAPPWHDAASGFLALKEITYRDFVRTYGFLPEVFPFFLALKGMSLQT